MMWTGLIVLAFIIYHLAHFTLYWTNSDYGKLEDVVAPNHTRHDVYAMVTHAFSNPIVVAIYLAAMAVVFVHLSHGVASMFQSLGLSNHRWSKIRRRASRVVVGLLILGFIAVPLGVKFGLVERNPKEKGAKNAVSHTTSANTKDAASR
jgi:succinate dehydrogenase / fumarate reductase cytochrome b subunit